MNAAHLFRTRHALVAHPLDDARQRHVADKISDLSRRDAVLGHVRCEFHDEQLVPKLGTIATPKWGTTLHRASGTIPIMGNRLKLLRNRKGWTLDETAIAMGMSRSGYLKLEGGDRKLSDLHIRKAAAVFGVSTSQILEQRMVEIAGYAGAGPDGSVLFAESHENFGYVPAPIDASADAKALEVRGDSMYGLANDGWLLFYDEKTEPREEYIGEPCACWLPDGRVLIKIPERARTPGLFDLISTNAPPLRDQVVESMALITDIKPRRAAQRYIRRNPDDIVEDVRIDTRKG